MLTFNVITDHFVTPLPSTITPIHSRSIISLAITHPLIIRIINPLPLITLTTSLTITITLLVLILILTLTIFITTYHLLTHQLLIILQPIIIVLLTILALIANLVLINFYVVIFPPYCCFY